MKILFLVSLGLCLLNLGIALWSREFSLVGAWLSATLGWGVACMELWNNS